MRAMLPLLLTLAIAGCGKGADADGDGFYEDQDCDDEDASSYPGAPELCDSIDNDCDGEADEDPAEGTWYADVDGDGFGNPEYTTNACSQPAGYVDNADDCNDLNALSYPDAEEWCDGEDNNCNDEVDEDGVDEGIFYPDNDGDGYGQTGAIPVGGCAAPEGYVENDDDCDDDDADVNPETFWYGDSDGDGYGNVLFYLQACEAPAGYVHGRDDCDDGDGSVYPGAPEVCDGLDNDCDGDVDDDDADVVDQPTWYTDADLDGYGDEGSGVVQCDPPSDAVGVGGDCDDASDAVYPGAFDGCDGLDNDCDGVTDSGCPLEIDTADVELTGTPTSDYFGYHLEGGDDLNGDGVGDLVVGAYGNDVAGSSAGAVYVYYGPLTGSYSDGDANFTVTGVSSSDYLGYAVGDPTDLNGDGQADLMISAYGNDDGASGAGAAYIWYGPLSAGTVSASAADAEVLGISDTDSLGQYFLGGGELTGDSYGDFVVGAHAVDDNGSSSGAIYVFQGPLSGSTSASDADTVFLGQEASEYVGYPLVTDADFNGDGQDDIAWGASGSSGGSGAQEVYVFYGPLATGSFTGVDADVTVSQYESADATGSHVESGDMDGDGNVDLIIGAKYNDEGGSSAGAVHGLYGPFSASMSLATDGAFLVAETGASRYFGGQYNGIESADVDGDGNDDVVMGCRSNGTNGTNSGGAFFFYGPITGTYDVDDADRSALGQSSGVYVGGATDFADINGDGLLDLVVGSRGWSTSRGRVGAWDNSEF